jgi:hypothetical protein
MAGEEIHGWLVQLSGLKSGERYAIEGEGVEIGRGTTCQIQLNDPKVSRLHARIVFKNGGLIVEDLNSAHGVLVNNLKVQKASLTDGDRLQLGDTQFRLERSPDSIATVLAPPGEPIPAQEVCRYCESPIIEGQAYCETCGAVTRKLPEPFEFIQQAYLRLRALHQSGKMDDRTFRSELEKMIVADGSGGYWMVGIRGGRWHWFNGKEWIPRDPPKHSLRQAPIEPTPSVLTPPVPPTTEPSSTEIEEGKHTGRFFFIAGGTLAAFSILALGAYAAFKLVKADEQLTSPEFAGQPVVVSTTAPMLASSTVEVGTEALEELANTATPHPTPIPTSTPPAAHIIRTYDPEVDENLINLADLATYNELMSGPEHAIYEGSWETERPARFAIGWCATDEPTLAQNLEVIELTLTVDGEIVEPALMFSEDFQDEGMACRLLRTIVQFNEPGEHRLLWTTSYDEPVFDGWQTLEAGTYLNEYIYDIRDVVAVEDEFETSSGNWDETEQQNFSQWIEGGRFHIQVHKENFAAWSIYHDLEFDDSLILVEAKRNGAIPGSYGLIFRYQDVNNFYYFMVDETGFFTLGKRFAGDWIALIDWTAVDPMSGDDFNHLGIVLSGNEIMAFLNGESVGVVKDDSFVVGGAGLIAQSGEDVGEMHAEFDRFYLEYYP